MKKKIAKVFVNGKCQGDAVYKRGKVTIPLHLEKGENNVELFIPMSQEKFAQSIAEAFGFVSKDPVLVVKEPENDENVIVRGVVHDKE